MVNPDENLIKDVARQFSEGQHCSQVTFAYAAKKLGYDEKTARKISAPFGGGMFNGERCGAVTGALMGLGLKYGHSCVEERPSEAILHEKRKELEKRVREEYGTLMCADIIGASFGSPEDVKKIKEQNLCSVCPKLAAYVCELLDELL